MALPACAECAAIHRELLELVEMSRKTKPGPGATPQELADWFDQRDEDEDYKMSVREVLSSLKRRMIEHQKLTGHVVRLLPRGGLNDPN